MTMNVPRVWATVMTLLLSLRGVCGQSNWIQSLFFKDTQSKSMTRGSRRRMSMVNPSTEYSQPITDDAPMSTSAPSLVTTSRPKKTKSTGGSSMSNSTMNSTASDMKSSNTTTIPSSTSIKNSTSSKTTPSTAISSKQSDPVYDDVAQLIDDGYNMTRSVLPPEKEPPTSWPLDVFGIFVGAAIVLFAATAYKNYRKRKAYTPVPTS